LVSNAYQAPERQDTIRIALISEWLTPGTDPWLTQFSLCYRSTELRSGR